MPEETEVDIEDGIVSITGSAFKGYTNLVNVTIPESVTELAGGVFGDWTSSQTIYIKGRTTMPDGWSQYWDNGCKATIAWNAL